MNAPPVSQKTIEVLLSLANAVATMTKTGASIESLITQANAAIALAKLDARIANQPVDLTDAGIPKLNEE